MTPLVLIPGHMCDGRMWGPQVAAFSGMRSVLLAAIAGADSMAALAAGVLAEAPPRFALAGLSMGGILAMEVARQAPERVERIALLDTNPLPEAEEVRAARRERVARVRDGHLAAIVREEMKPMYLADGPGKQPVLDLCYAMALDLGPEVFARQSTALMHRPDQQSTLAGLRVPALILTGEEDRLVPRDRFDLLRRLMPWAAAEVVPGAGHLPVLERPEATTAALARWLAA